MWIAEAVSLLDPLPERCRSEGHSGGQSVLQSDSARAGDREERPPPRSTCGYVPVRPITRSVSGLMTSDAQPANESMERQTTTMHRSMGSRVRPRALGSRGPTDPGTVLAEFGEVARVTFG